MCRVQNWEKLPYKDHVYHKGTEIMASSPITLWQIEGGKVQTVTDILFFWAPRLLQMVIAAMKLKDTYSLEGKL